MPHVTNCRALTLFCFFLVSGCGESRSRGAVSGIVTLDDVAIETGSISFIPVEGTNSPTSGAVIAMGKYEISREKGPIAGTFRVEIRAQRKTGNRIAAGSPAPPGTMIDETEDAIPARYNSESTLRVEITTGSNSHNFKLSTK
ncbi:MAG: hypothetical protein EXS16_16985 [Gemmataceae bacterium]|nr:hypothetical protein [Gemmataceae bacterium]